MDAAKKTASSSKEGDTISPSDQYKGEVLVDTIKEHYRRVPDYFEPKDLVSKLEKLRCRTIDTINNIRLITEVVQEQKQAE